MFGMLLGASEDRWFDSFEIGFWHDPSEPGYQLIVHDFTADRNLSVAGFELPIGYLDNLPSPIPSLLSLIISIDIQFLHPSLICVIKKFNTDALENVPNISYFELLFHTEDDDDDSVTDSDFEWPSSVFDRGRALV
ncbi:hypothetical protein PQX77_018723 [Marasmius sp. AFHP31]|nr:hypothetical protein PQX77_018723 [Marasmius sp. AFHP31]